LLAPNFHSSKLLARAGYRPDVRDNLAGITRAAEAPVFIVSGRFPKWQESDRIGKCLPAEPYQHKVTIFRGKVWIDNGD
jgi:hypothetical protein